MKFGAALVRSGAAIPTLAAFAIYAAVSWQPASASPLYAGAGLGPAYGGGVVVSNPSSLPLSQGWAAGGAPIRYIPLSDAALLTEAVYGPGSTPPAGGYGKIGDTAIAFGNQSFGASINQFLGDPTGSRGLVTSFGGFNPQNPVGNTFFQFQGTVTLAQGSYFRIAHDDGFDLRLFRINQQLGGLGALLGALESSPAVFDNPTLGPWNSNTAFGPGSCATTITVDCYAFYGLPISTNVAGDYLFVLSYASNGVGVSRLIADVPEPAGLGVIGLAILGLALALRHARRAPAEEPVPAIS